jgi:drug/metabolite transporter (DMT)-like permease
MATSDRPLPASSAPATGQRWLWVALLTLVMFAWGNVFIAMKEIVTYVSPLHAVTVRFVPAALGYAVWLLAARRRETWTLLRAETWRLPLMGLIGSVITNAAVAWGETRVPAGTASLIVSLNPVFTVLFAVLFLGERFNGRQALGLGVAFAGLFVVIRWGSGRQVTLTDVGYALITMIAPLGAAIHSVMVKPIVARHPPLLVTAVTMVFTGLFSLTFARPSLVADLASLPATFWGAVAFLSIPCNVFAFLIWLSALERMPAGQAAGFLYLVPLFGVLSSSLLLKEPVTTPLLVGAAILIAGIWIVNRE